VFGARAKTIRFDLSDDRHEQFLLKSAKVNARIWEEQRHGVRYWGPIDDKDWFKVVYRLDVGFPIGSASLRAPFDLYEADSQGILEVSSDPDQGWTPVVGGPSTNPRGGQIDVSEIVRGSRLVYVRARLKGRDDHDDSAMAQFLRTSILLDSHLEVKTPNVFELRAYDREVPIVIGMVRFNDGWSKQFGIREDGSFEFIRKFSQPGKYTGTIVLTAAKVQPMSRTFDVWVNSTGWEVKLTPFRTEIHQGKLFQAGGKLAANNPSRLSGIVDYGDGAGEQELIVEPNASFRLEHLYREAGRYSPRVTIRDEAGHLASGLSICDIAAR